MGMNGSIKKRKDSFFGIHCDFHGKPENGLQGKTLNEEEIRDICRTLKPDFIQIDCKGHPGWTSYPSKLGNALPEFAIDTLEVWRRVTREENVALYLHYSGVYDIKYCEEHPEECAVDADGRFKSGATLLDGRYADDLLIPQFSEIAENYGVDGFWVDGECWKAETDFRPQSIASFEKEYGVDLGGKLPATADDPYYQEYREYHRELFRKYLRRYVDILHEKYPDLQIASNWAFSDHMPEPVSANVDFLSGDLNHRNSLNSARYAARALAQQGYPWDLMSWNFRIFVGNRSACVSKHINQILQEAASVISLGGAFQNYLPQFKDGSPHTRELKNLLPLANFMRDREAFCFRGAPLHQAALLLSTHDRSIEAQRLYSRTGYEKVMGMTALLCDIGQSLEIVCEHTLKKSCNEYKMIVVPELYSGLKEETKAMLLDYAERGGKLLLAGKNTCRIFAQSGAPFEVVAHDEYYAQGKVAYDNGHGGEGSAKHKAYYFTLDAEYFGSLFSPCEISAKDGYADAYLKDDQRGSSYPLAVTVSYGNGSVTAVGFDLGSQYLEGSQYLHKELLRKLTDRLYTPKVKLESACGILEIVPLIKDGRLMIQLINGGGSHANASAVSDDYIPPVLDISLSVALDKEPRALILQPEGRPLDFKYCGDNGRAYVNIDRVDIHSIIEVVTK